MPPTSPVSNILTPQSPTDYLHSVKTPQNTSSGFSSSSSGKGGGDSAPSFVESMRQVNSKSLDDSAQDGQNKQTLLQGGGVDELTSVPDSVLQQAVLDMNLQIDGLNGLRDGSIFGFALDDMDPSALTLLPEAIEVAETLELDPLFSSAIAQPEILTSAETKISSEAELSIAVALANGVDPQDEVIEVETQSDLTLAQAVTFTGGVSLASAQPLKDAGLNSTAKANSAGVNSVSVNTSSQSLEGSLIEAEAGTLKSFSSNEGKPTQLSALLSGKDEFTSEKVAVSKASIAGSFQTLVNASTDRAAASQNPIESVSPGSLLSTPSIAGQVAAPDITRANIPVNVAFGSAQWTSSMAERTAWAVGQNIQAADIQLDPPELGPLQVKIHVSNDQASVSFVSANPLVREALDQTMSRLKDLLQEQGLELVDSGVSDHPGKNQDNDNDNESPVNRLISGAEPEDPEEQVTHLQVSVPQGIDYFA